MTKFAAVTTFPDAAWNGYAKSMLDTYCELWPKEAPIMVRLDYGTEKYQGFMKATRGEPLQPNEAKAAHVALEVANCYRNGIDAITCGITKEQAEFIARNGQRPVSKDYRSHYVRFSHKVFAMKLALDTIRAGIPENIKDAEYLIWIDADVVTKRLIPVEAIEKWLPADNQIASYLGRKDWSESETGLIIFNLKNGGDVFIENLWGMYVNDTLLENGNENLTDAYAFDLVRAKYGADKFRNLSENIGDRDVFEASLLGEYLEHYKGPRKNELAPQGSTAVKKRMAYDANRMQIQTRNCVDHEVIQKNVETNMKLIPHDKWLPICKPKPDEEIVICSGGPSLSPDDIMPWVKKGAKIVAVKHALDRLLKWDIVPWAVILLDPRQHVGGFVEYPHRDINYFVASMCDPQVTIHLLKHKMKVWGYHASVGAEEDKFIPNGHVIVQGGSATATRGLSLLEGLGFRKMHLYGYDCCYLEKPDLSDQKENGRMKYEEITLTAESWGGMHSVRTFWTEGQFLAQIQEMSKLYFPKPNLELHTYGDGVIPWMHKHLNRYNAWKDWVLDREKKELDASKDVEELLNGRSTG